MGTKLEFHLCHGQAMRDLREAVASTPRVSLGADGVMLLTFTKPDGTVVTVILRDIQEQMGKEQAAQTGIIEDFRRDLVPRPMSPQKLKSRGSYSVTRRSNSNGACHKRNDGGTIG